MKKLYLTNTTFTLFLLALLLLVLFACTKDKDPQPTEHPQKAELNGHWIPGGYAVYTLYADDTTEVMLDETHVYQYTFEGDSVVTWFDNWTSDARPLRYPLELPDGMEHSHINGSSSKSEFEVVKLTDDTLQLKAVYDYSKVYQFGGKYYNTRRSELVLTFVLS